MATKNWTEERTAQLESMVDMGTEVSQATLEAAAEALEVTKRSVGAKLRKLGYAVELASTAVRSKWSDAEEAALRELLQSRDGDLTYAEVSAAFEGGKYSPTAKKIMHVDTSLNDANKSPKKAICDLDSIEKDIRRIKLLICEMHGYVYRGEIPDHAAVL